ncbi:MAG: penicillin-binding protein 2 [bacterium]|nr:penicillin-binding protein 2 [bacterium]
MDRDSVFFVPDADSSDMHVSQEESAEIRHEVFYESDFNHLGDHALYIGRSFQKKRFLIAFTLIAVCFSGLFVRAVWMQGFQFQNYFTLAERNRLRQTPLWPRRGMMLDRNGIVLAENMSRFQAVMTPRDLPREKNEREAVLGVAARLLGQSTVDLIALVNATTTVQDEQSVLATNLPYEQAMAFAVALPRLPGFALQVGSQRRYPQSQTFPSLSHVLGYVGKLSPEEYAANKTKGYQRSNEIGKTGLEKSYEKDLRGTAGERLSEVDARGNIKATVREVPPIDGKQLHLTIDAELQKTAERALANELAIAHADRGAVVALNPQDGSILALVSLPSYDDNAFSSGVSSTVYQALKANPNQPLFPRAWAGTYPSGSTAKIVISAAALAEHVITPETTVNSIGGINVGPWFFPDWKAGGHGITNVRKAIALSVNTFYYTIGGGYESFIGLGVDRLTTWMRKFGLGNQTGIDLPGEAKGFVPDKEWKLKTKKIQWYIGDTYNLSIGQGDLLVTPLQVADYTATIANGGTRIKPHLVMSEDEGAPISYATSSIPGLDRATVEVVRQGMRDAVAYGSARGIGGLPFSAGGKTGTAQWSSDPAKKTHAWFTCFAPYEKPEIVITVLLEEGGEGSSVSVPVARQVLQKWWELREAKLLRR